MRAMPILPVLVLTWPCWRHSWLLHVAHQLCQARPVIEQRRTDMAIKNSETLRCRLIRDDVYIRLDDLRLMLLSYKPNERWTPKDVLAALATQMAQVEEIARK